MGAFYSTFIDDEADKARLQPGSNRFAQALERHGLAYRAWDFSAEEAEHWRLKLQVLKEMRADFAAEDNLFLHEQRMREAMAHQQYVESGRLSRYLYRIEALA
jgi:hypothetical protein